MNILEMNLSKRRLKMKLKLKKITLSKEEDFEDTADSLSNYDSPKPDQSPKSGKFNQTKVYKINPNLFMSGYHSAADLKTLKQNQITHVINLTSQYCQNLHESFVSYSNFQLSDNSNFDLTPFLEEITKTIYQKIEQGQKVLVHCKMGVSRAPSVIIAFLIKQLRMDFYSAFNHVHQINSKISPNLGYLMQLQKL